MDSIQFKNWVGGGISETGDGFWRKQINDGEQQNTFSFFRIIRHCDTSEK